ncbi:MAG TPA: signal peptidase II [Anaerolineaceae bacterium]|nr:signal peptidase II [Anaerolineaceae bacterium]
MKKFLQTYAPLLLVAGLIILLDQLTKSWVRSSLVLGEVWIPWESALPFVKIVNWYNTGVAFGMLQGMGTLFIVLHIIVAIAIIYFYPRVSPGDWPLKLALTLQLGGAVGNLIDRVTLGHVTDFVWIGWFPVFNVADASISVGVAVLLLGVWLQDRRQRQQPSEPLEAPVEPPTNVEGNG